MASGGEEVVATVLDADENEISEIPVSPSEEDRGIALRKLRGRWELASVLNFFQVFEPQIETGTTFSAEEIELALIEPNDLLAQIHRTLLKGIPPVNKIMNEGDAWITVLCKKIANWWPWVAEGDIPLTVNKGEEVSRYKKLDPMTRLQILKALCEIRADQHDAVGYINDALKDGTEISYFRKDKIGEENGTTYWYDGNEHIGFRLYKEVVNIESNRTAKGISAVPPVGLWETIATDLEEFRKAVNDSSFSRSKVEMAVLETIEAEVVPVLEKLEKKKERAAKMQQKLQEAMLKGFHNSRTTRSTRVSSRSVSYTFEDYDKAINEAIQVTNEREALTRNQKVKNITKNASDLENSGSDIDNAKENCKDFSGDEKNNRHSSSSLSEEENDNGGRRINTRNRRKQTGNNVVVTKKLLRQRPSCNTAIGNAVIPDSGEESSYEDKSS